MRERRAPAPDRRPAGRRGRVVANLGPLLCWAVVFADIGTSVYYTPGILFNQVGRHAALFVGLTLIVFVLLTLKYAEVAIRYPEGGGVVTVGAHAANNFVGLLGGLLILVDYFLTAALSALSGIIYLSLLAPGMKGLVVALTVGALVFLALLNLAGISADAKVTAGIAAIAIGSQLAVVVAVFVHVGAGPALGAFPRVLSGPPLTGVALITGYAGAFLAFSGLESISQLSPAIAEPRRRTVPRALLLVVVTVVATSPLLTLWATTLLDPRGIDPNQFISLLGGYAGGPVLQAEVAASAALLLVFASNTAIIGSYHVFLALSRIRFLPGVLRHINRRLGTPHWSILAATAVPIAVVVFSRGDTNLLGDMYSFGLLGAFSVTCVSLDIVRWRERSHTQRSRDRSHAAISVVTSTPMFVIGIITSALVVTAWMTNLVAKPLATLFGGIVVGVGLIIAALTYWILRRRGQRGTLPFVLRPEQLRIAPGRTTTPPPLLALVGGTPAEAAAVASAGLDRAGSASVIFAYIAALPEHTPPRRLREIVDPYLTDDDAHAAFAAARDMAASRRHRAQLVYEAARGRGEALSRMRERFSPGAIVVREQDAALLGEAGADQQRRVLEHDGVTLVLYSSTVRISERDVPDTT